MNETIEVTDKFGNTKKVQVIIKYHDKDTNNNYIVYQYNDEYFAAKYDDIVGQTKLNSDLSDKEIEALEKLLNKVLGENI